MTNATTLPTLGGVTRTEIAHGVTSTGAERARQIGLVIERVKRERLAAGAKRVEVVNGREQGTLMVLEWTTDEAVARDGRGTCAKPRSKRARAA